MGRFVQCQTMRPGWNGRERTIGLRPSGTLPTVFPGAASLVVDI